MKCQSCKQSATHHVTDIVAGKPVEYHVCDKHLQELDALEPAPAAGDWTTGFAAFWNDDKLRAALEDQVAREKIAAHLLPALSLALLDDNPHVRVVAAFRIMALGPDSRSTLGALRDALRDPDERVRKAAEVAVNYIQNENIPRWWLF